MMSDSKFTNNYPAQKAERSSENNSPNYHEPTKTQRQLFAESINISFVIFYYPIPS